MTLRTPRRRISPQTRRRCRAIKGFFKRALGSISQPDILQITSSIAVNVTDISHKIGGLEHQLNEVCKSYRENFREINSVRSKNSNHIGSRSAIGQREIPSGTKLKEKETNILYSKPKHQYKDSVESDYAILTNNDSNRVKSENTMNTYNKDERLKSKKKKSKPNNRGIDYDVQSNYQKHKTESSHKYFVSAYSTSSFHSLDQFRKMNSTMPSFSGNDEEQRYQTKQLNSHHFKKVHRKPSPERYEEKANTTSKNKKSKNNAKDLDSDFIADIIRRQYRPVKFGRRNSDLSQFSAPVCRDRDFCLRAECYNIPEEHQICNCERCYYNRYNRHNEFSDTRSVCDARHYNVRRNLRTKHRRKQDDVYDNSDFYDLVPVKEKTSPQSRRKFLEDNMRSTHYKEVPPSPRTQRPQLNLKARNAESDCNIEIVRNYGRRIPQKHTMRFREMEDHHQSVNRSNTALPKNVTRFRGKGEFGENCEVQTKRKHNNLVHADDQRENSIISGIYPVLATEDPTAPVETHLNKTQESVSSDKTDKALCEIKDILQSFLLEIKKDSSSPNQRSDVNAKITENGNIPLNNANTMTSTRHSFSNLNSAHCPVAPSPFMPAMPAFGNTCCYPLMPMCPINCMQNSYAMPSASFTHNNCVDKSNETYNSNNKIYTSESCETDELIKEIYKFVSQSPTFGKKHNVEKEESNSKHAFRSVNKVLTSRSAGGSTRVRRNDAKVGTPKMRCVSKSCEAIKFSSDVYSSDTNPSFSDTLLDKVSLEATQSTSDTESSTEVSTIKVKRSKFAKMLKTLGLSKKIKKDVIEELSESETTTVDDVRRNPPFRQDLTNYAMHGHEYFSPPPVSPNYRPEYPHDYRPPYNPDVHYWDPRIPQSGSHGSPHPQYRPEACPTAPPYSQSYDSYDRMQPQVPLCLKEVEVKSIGCQSERKFSFFQKITQKMQPPMSAQNVDLPKNGSTQTPQKNFLNPQSKPALFDWKKPQSKFLDTQTNPIAFGYQTQKKLAQGDMKIRNAMFKKLFYKRNPFSPRNLIIRTLLGNDKSSFGDPPKGIRARMFM